ncbi:MAG: 3-phosphoserine/phosphohydroxythreonine transaminase [Luteitalea sp.]|nr:3-phosphoserine/phosphohydroxythreonine transaminase [Luteitalea sp.]
MITNTTVHRIFNFSAGPAILPLPVLEEAQRDLVSLPGVGMSVLEISHRSKAFERRLQEAVADLRALASIPDNYHVLFLHGGASLQFSMVPMNLVPPGGTGDYIVTGAWSQKAVKEAKRVGAVHVAASTESEGFARIPRQDEIRLSADGAYVHVTSNNTIYGTQWRELPEVGDRPLVSDASSDIFNGPIDVSRHALIYAGAQKNLGPAGVTLVIIRDDIARRSPSSLPTMLSYATHVDNGSLYNTPPVFAIYMVGLVAKWLRAEGGLQAVGTQNERKAAKLYAAIDRTDFYRGHAQPDSRSLMNVTFRLPSEELEKAFVADATANGLDGLKGHRSVGGIRASIYNAFPEEGVDALTAFMREFERKHG